MSHFLYMVVIPFICFALGMLTMELSIRLQLSNKEAGHQDEVKGMFKDLNIVRGKTKK